MSSLALSAPAFGLWIFAGLEQCVVGGVPKVSQRLPIDTTCPVVHCNNP